eukprot:19027_1
MQLNMAQAFICTKRSKTNAMLIMIAISISMTMVMFGYIFVNFADPDAENIEDVIADQVEHGNSRLNWFETHLADTVIKSKQDYVESQLKSSLIKQVTKSGRELQKFNENIIINNNSEIYLYDSVDLLESSQDDYPWGHIYRSRVWCSVLTMWPERRQNIEAVANTWASLCDKIIFVVDNSTKKPPVKPPKNESDSKKKRREKRKKKTKKILYEWEEAPDSHLGFDFLKLPMDEPQSEDWRNIWEKSWKTWYHVGKYHINNSEWFLKIDDDTFFSPINFKGFARYFNPNKPWYFGNTLMHLWRTRNIVFNAGSCYVLSRGALKKLIKVFESNTFKNPSPTRKKKGENCKCLCMKRPGAFEDPSMGVCLHSIGIDPTNTLDKYNRERFSPFREKYHKRLKWKSSFWYFHLKPKQLGIKKECCAKHPISFHFYKHDKVKDFNELHIQYNIEQGINGKVFEIPQYPTRFKHRQDLNFSVDKWRNSFDSKVRGQLVYGGPGKEKMCWKCKKPNTGK